MGVAMPIHGQCVIGFVGVMCIIILFKDEWEDMNEVETMSVRHHPR